VGTSRGNIRKGDQRMEIFVHIYVNGKMGPGETIPGMWGGE
jgi:hypothetical protein